MVEKTEMIADPKQDPHQDDGKNDKRRRQEEALDDALKNTFPASDPVSLEQPTASARACCSRPLSFPKIASGHIDDVARPERE
jgi:hypothetical protein